MEKCRWEKFKWKCADNAVKSWWREIDYDVVCYLGTVDFQYLEFDHHSKIIQCCFLWWLVMKMFEINALWWAKKLKRRIKLTERVMVWFMITCIKNLDFWPSKQKIHSSYKRCLKMRCLLPKQQQIVVLIIKNYKKTTKCSEKTSMFCHPQLHVIQAQSDGSWIYNLK